MVTYLFIGNVCVKPYFNTQWGGGSPPSPLFQRTWEPWDQVLLLSILLRRFLKSAARMSLRSRIRVQCMRTRNPLKLRYSGLAFTILIAFEFLAALGKLNTEVFSAISRNCIFTSDARCHHSLPYLMLNPPIFIQFPTLVSNFNFCLMHTIGTMVGSLTTQKIVVLCSI